MKKVLIVAILLSMVGAAPVLANNGTDAGNGSHNIDNKGPNGENNCAGGGCASGSPSHQFGSGHQEQAQANGLSK